MVHGIYCDPATGEEARLNCIAVCEALKPGFTNAIDSELVTRHSEYLAFGDDQRHIASQQFFEQLDLLGLLNESEQHLIFKRASDRLLGVHLGMNNFHNEPPFAERLLELSKQVQVPATMQQEFVEVVIGCYVGNGYGHSWAAEPSYERIIRDFSQREVLYLIQASKGKGLVARKLANPLCRERYRHALGLIDPSTVPNSVKPAYEAFLS